MTRKRLGHRIAGIVKDASIKANTARLERSVVTSTPHDPNDEVVLNARERRATKTDLNGKRLHRVRIERYRATTRAIFPLEYGDQVIDLTYFRQLPNLEKPLTEAFKIWGTANRPNTRMEIARDLKRGFAKFLSTAYPDVSLQGLDTTVLTAFIKWIDEKISAKTGKSTSPNYRRKNITAIRVLLTALIGHREWGKDVEVVLIAFPERTHLHAQQRTVPRERLTREHLEAIDAAAQREIHSIRTRLAEGKRLLAEGQEQIAQGNMDFSNLAVMLAEISRRYPNALPNYKQLRRESPDLYEWAYRSNKGNRGFGLTTLGSYLYASPRDLVPFVLLLTIEGGFNAESVLALEQSQVALVDRFGTPSVRIAPPKPRGARSPIKYLDPVWVLPWFETLEQLTRRLRPSLPQENRDRVFVYAQMWGEARTPTAFHKQGTSQPALWHPALQMFIRENGLESFSLSQIRPTESDEIGLTHGSLAASQALDHVSFSTTELSYLSSGTREREGEQLCIVVDQMKRWVQSAGKIDTRRAKRTPKMDRGCATPGYSCADPYESPRQGQSKNRLCSAYGECPSCEHARSDHDDPISVAYNLALRGAIVAGQEGMPYQAWLEKWAPILRDLSSQIDLIPESAIRAANQFHIILPAVG
jgi:hypothetical protein